MQPVPAPEAQLHSIRLKEPSLLSLLQALAGDDVQVDANVVGGLLLELQRHRDAAAKAKADRPSTLETAAEALLSVMEPNHRDQILDAALNYPAPAWVIMLGTVARACDGMELLNGEMNPEWLNNPEAVKISVELPKCEACGLEIPGGRRGQRFCCSRHGSGKPDHSPECVLVPRPVEAG